MLASARLETVVLFVQSLERSIRFYRDTLGLPGELIQTHDGPLATLAAGPVTLVLIPQAVQTGQSPVLVFELPGGIDDCVETLIGHGVEIALPVSDAPDGGLTMDFLDPDGHLLSLHQSAKTPRRHTAG